MVAVVLKLVIFEVRQDLCSWLYFLYSLYPLIQPSFPYTVNSYDLIAAGTYATYVMFYSVD